VTSHAGQKIQQRGLLLQDIIEGLNSAKLIEDYTSPFKGPTILVFMRDTQNLPVHAVWGIPKNSTGPAYLVTAYRPDPLEWRDDHLTRRKP